MLDILDFLNDEKRDLEFLNDNDENIIFIDDIIKDSSHLVLNHQYQLLYPNCEDYESSYQKFSKSNNFKELQYA